MGCASGCAKCCLNTINVLLAIGSVSLIAIGSVFIGNGPSLMIYLFLIVGGLGLIASILGCCGICMEHAGLTIAYAVFIFLMLLMQIGGLLFAKNIDGVRKSADEDISNLWDKRASDPAAMDFPQIAFKCCGKFGSDDYNEGDIPKSCFPHQDSTLPVYPSGCIAKAEQAYVKLVRRTMSGSWGSIAFTIIMLAFSIYLIMRFRRKQRYYNY